MYNVGNRVMNTYLYRIKDGYVMIDTGYENSYQKCTSSMKRQGISWDDVKASRASRRRRMKWKPRTITTTG
ncbi:MAG TPA: MBL fold metallo-hydrolase [Candidatus Merdisoma merdipullorum]|nr:MBL fold metallo-hydrolase [Candidatus Merdisoma merdipullorum]